MRESQPRRKKTGNEPVSGVNRADGTQRLACWEILKNGHRFGGNLWVDAGGQILAAQNATVQITDLNSEWAFGFVGTRMIQLDDDALGFGWHVGSGPVPAGL